MRTPKVAASSRVSAGTTAVPSPWAASRSSSASNALLSELNADAAQAFLDVTGPGAAVPVVAGFRHLGGALHRPAPAAVDHRDARYVARFITGPGGAEVRDHHELIRKTLSPWTVGHHLNFLYGAGDWADEDQTRTGFTADTYARLAAVKRNYDPANLFRANRNIRPGEKCAGTKG
ncbi:BBE domain-containing protein [Nocardia sp. NPDC051570]|uniref:BBE domain-containing protein n=1 Tax=Nocardia sp. NPDC051570 TaxID=3364324 RepID=UPI0037AE0D85